MQGKIYSESALAALCEDSITAAQVSSGSSGQGSKSVQSGSRVRGAAVSGGDVAAAARLVLNKGYTVSDRKLVRIKQ